MNQFEYERYALDRGAAKFAYSERQKRLSGQTDDTEVGASVIRQRLLDVAEVLEKETARKITGIGGAYAKAVRVAATRYDGEQFYQDYNLVAYITLTTMLQAAYSKNDRESFLTQLAKSVGARLENDQRLYVFTQDNPAFVGKIQDSLRAANNVSYRHRLMTFQKKYRDAEMKWEPWGNLQCIQVGIRCIRAVLTSMEDCFELTKKQNGRNLAYYVDTTLAFDDFVIDETELRALSRPMNLPMIEAPIPYERVDGEVTGGYHTATLRRLSPFIKTRGPEHKAFVDAHFPYKHMTAVNSLQSTAWQANPAVVDAVTRIAADGLLPDHLPKAVATEIPPRPDTEDEERILQWKQDARRVYGRNKKNKVAMMQLRQNLEFLWEIGDDPFWFTYSCDFRGRLYCNSPLASMQGEDHLKAMIRFKEGKVMGERGLHWLAVHGANKYGYDKVPYADRVRWVHDHRDDIQEVVRFPTGSRALSFLRGADKPFQFLAFANEWADAGYGTDPSAVGYLPIGLDGSCNGLQHYAALLRDPRGGQAVNLVNGDTPSDIYGDVADALRARLAGITDDVATRFLAGGFDRKLTKRPVMTLPYGATQQSCRAYVREYIKDHAEKFGMHPDDDTAQWKLAVAITPHVWAAIGDVVVGGRQGMAWLQKCASMANKQEVFMHWLSPADFPVYQPYQKYPTMRVATEMFGEMRIKVRGEPSGLHKTRARNGIAPNFVHALDSSHMVFTILKAKEEDITALACIHDDYGTHAADTDRFFHIIREAFVEMYDGHDWLKAWQMEIQRQCEDLLLPDPPEYGDLDVKEVLSSEFFFG